MLKNATLPQSRDTRQGSGPKAKSSQPHRGSIPLSPAVPQLPLGKQTLWPALCPPWAGLSPAEGTYHVTRLWRPLTYQV